MNASLLPHLNDENGGEGQASDTGETGQATLQYVELTNELGCPFCLGGCGQEGGEDDGEDSGEKDERRGEDGEPAGSRRVLGGCECRRHA